MYAHKTQKCSHRFSLLISAAGVLPLLGGGRAFAEPAQLSARMQPVALDSGVVNNRTNTAQMVLQQIIDLGTDVPWARVFFDEVGTVLPPGSYIRVTSLLDGETQTLDAQELSNWSYGTAFFNGSQIEVQLIAGANTSGSKLAIGEVFAGEPAAAVAARVGAAAAAPDDDSDEIFTICGGNDDRKLTAHAAIGRLLRGGIQTQHNVNKVCSSGTNAGGQCRNDDDCPPLPPLPGICVTPGQCRGGANAGMACFEPCAEGLCVGICDGGTQDLFTCTSVAQCPGGTCRAGRCSNGANINGPCDSNANCPAGPGGVPPAGVCEGLCLGGGLVKCTVPCPASFCEPVFHPGVCTAWIEYSNPGVDKIHLTAGHCFLPEGVEDINQGVPAPPAAVLQFNVPASNANCTINHPPVASQFPVRPETVIAHAIWNGNNTVAGTDWAVFKCGENNEGKTTYEKQGTAFTLVALPAVNDVLRVSGHGKDGSNLTAGTENNSCTKCPVAAADNGTRNFVLQTKTGPLTAIGGAQPDRLEHQVDTCGGNSGSPMFLPSNNEGGLNGFGIHTHGGCFAGAGGADAGANAGIAVTHQPLQDALETLKGKKPRPPLDFAIDHFKVWTTDPEDDGPYIVDLVDQFRYHSIQVTLLTINRFANAVEKYHEGNLYPRLDPNAHLIWYPIYVSQPQREIAVYNQLWPLGVNLKVKDAKYVLVPAVKSGGGPPNPAFNGDLYLCYDVVDPVPVNEPVTLLDQFDEDLQQQEIVTVTIPVYFCNPVQKLALMEHPDDHLVFYLIPPPPTVYDGPVTAADQFGVHDLFVRDSNYLGVPTKKVYVGPPSGACCLGNNECVLDETQDKCVKLGGRYLGDGTTACVHSAAGDCIPTVSQWGLAVMSLLILTSATMVIMRRRTAAA